MENSAEQDNEISVPYDPAAVSASPTYFPNTVFDMKSSINIAIRGGNLERVIQLLDDGKKLNLADSHGFTPLHVAAYYQNLEILEMLLQQPLIKKDMRTHQNETALFLSLLENADDAVIIKLIESGCDVNIPNLKNVTPLSLAVTRDATDVARLLIEKGADVDAKDFDGYTPLHNAVTLSHYEAVCMLLYYSASVNEISFNTKVTPFLLAINLKEDRIAELLLDYTTDFNSVYYEGRSTLYWALCLRPLLTERILLQYSDMENIKHSSLCLKEAMRWKDHSLFKEIFPKINHVKLACEMRVLQNFVHYCVFDPPNFIECLNLILSSKYAQLFTETCDTIIPLIKKFHEEISQEDRVKSLYLLFASGLRISYHDFWYIYKYFGFNKELETVFVAQPIIRNDDSIYTDMLHFTENCINIAWNIFYNGNGSVDEQQILIVMKHHYKELLVDYLKYFTIDCCSKENYFIYYNDTLLLSPNFGGIVEKLQKRNMASLKELCRNKIRKIIITKTQAKDMYKVYDSIKALPVPKVIQDILHLKQPLYN